jgi:hypothetical protein
VLVLEERNFVPLFKFKLCVLALDKIVATFVINFKITGKDFVLNAVLSLGYCGK